MKIKSGDIVWQEKTMINDKNYNDNKDCRVSVVIFSTQIDEKKLFVLVHLLIRLIQLRENQIVIILNLIWF